MTHTYVNWGESTVKLTWKVDSILPPEDLITSVHGFCFRKDKLLLVKLNHRGWDFPGGHLEAGESADECFRREALEEGYVTGTCSLLGHIIVDHSENPAWNDRSQYPKVGYQVFYRMEIEDVFTFDAQYESAERMFINPQEIKEFYHDWHDLYEEILKSALHTNKNVKRVNVMDTVKQNSHAWDKKVEEQAVYTKAVSTDTIEKGKAGDWSVTVTTGKPVPRNWFPDTLKGLKVLCLASGGGQQGPILAAAGADVTVVDISFKQLEQDEMVANRNGLQLKTFQADMSDLSIFSDEEFDLIIHPVANLFVEDISKVWQEASRVLKNNGILISGFTNPLLFIFDDEEDMKGNLVVKNSIPSSSLDHLTEEEIEAYLKSDQTIEFGHSLEDQIQGQIDAGLVITGLYEDDFGGRRPLDQFIKCFIATRAVKMKID